MPHLDRAIPLKLSPVLSQRTKHVTVLSTENVTCKSYPLGGAVRFQRFVCKHGHSAYWAVASLSENLL